ncbi:NAD(P)-dependent oxidoreductase [Roseomonas sp. PWR1]|uniref:NAD(P)-dependent oxidoreductase n=1 Tax=Roseomonas nitratireducens TaxID=2820810 RepID=A0ABS4AZ98_9PROT|nr:NAD(P)-dependent oxidoreductase [Neoroseomonas nitratireducens]MBP0466669.1 NAD(P)-dependent oxidoreductase [Neoroseomonas nitratireducens]
MTPILPPARVAFIGLGVMGAAMAANILKAGFRLTVSTRSRDKAEALLAAGADWAPTAQDAADGAACVCLCVPDTPDVEAVLFGDDGVVHGAAAGTVVIDFSTIAAAASADFARRMAERGVVLLDSPVSGGPQGAIDGTLTCMVGGADAGFSAARAVFDAVGKTITLLGPAGSGQICKSANQLIIVAAMQAAAEALTMGRKAGLDPALMRQALLGGSARSFVLESHAKRMLDGNFKPGFRAELMRKDMRLALGAVRENGVFAPSTALAAQMMEAVVNSGRGGDDCASIGALVAELSGVKG